MNYDYLSFCLLSIFVFLGYFFLGTDMTHAFGFQGFLDSTSYLQGDYISLSGKIDNYQNGEFVILQIINPEQSDLVHVDTFLADFEGNFEKKILADGPKWYLEGKYNLKLFYQGQEENLFFTFGFSNDTSDSEPTQDTPSQNDLSEKQANEKDQEIIDKNHLTPNTLNTFDSTSEKQNERPQEPKTHIPGFPSLEKSPVYYFERYSNENEYKNWFDSQFPTRTIEDVVGYEQTHIMDFPDNSKTPQYYISRYADELKYQQWFDSQFPNQSIYNVLGFPDPAIIPDWIKANVEWWSIGQITDLEFISAIQFLIDNQIIVISDLPKSTTAFDENVPSWVRNTASWWALDKISQEEFVNAIKFLVEKGIIIIT